MFLKYSYILAILTINPRINKYITDTPKRVTKSNNGIMQTLLRF